MSQKNYNNLLKNLIINYLESPQNHNIFFSDVDQEIGLNSFKEKVYLFRDKLKKEWLHKKVSRGIAIYLDRSCDYIALIFATWLAEGYFLPLSKNSPKKIIDYQIKQSEVSLIAKNIGKKIKLYKLNNSYNKFEKKNACYIIFTSGSTGEKKGVLISKLSFVKYIFSIKKIFKKKNLPKSLLINGEMTFDISLADIAFAIVFRAGISITDNSKNLISLIYLLKKKKINSLYAVPSTLEKLLNYFYKNKGFTLPFLKQINSGGELFSNELLLKLKKYFKRCEIYNFYGPTEFTINSFYHKVDMRASYAKEDVPIGRPLPGVNCFLKKIKKTKEQRELFLSGDQIMVGYINSKNPFKIYRNKIYYPTGDIVRRSCDGNYYFKGRVKDYIKHLGYRININSIENIINKKMKIKSKVFYKDNKIFIFIIKLPYLSKINFFKKARNYLENYEMPNEVFFVTKFLYNDSGKIDLNQMIKKFIK